MVIPVYKNEADLPSLLGEVAALAAAASCGVEAVFVVDGSPDGCSRILRQQLPLWPVKSQLIELSRNFGSFAAIAAGLACGRGDYYAVMAADLQEPPELVREFLAVMAAGEADIVLGSRSQRADPWPARVVSNAFWSVYRRLVVPEMPPGGADVFGCTRQVRDQLVAMRETNTNLIALLLWLGYRRKLIPYHRRRRRHGASSWTFSKKVRYAIDSVFTFTDLPLKIVLGVGAAGTAAAAAASVIVFLGWFAGNITVPGYTPPMLAAAFFGGSTVFALGVVGQYLWLTLQHARNRPAYVIRSMAAFDPAPETTPPDAPEPRVGAAPGKSR